MSRVPSERHSTVGAVNRARKDRLREKPLICSRKGAMPTIAQRQAAFEKRVLALALQSPKQKVLGVLAARIANIMGSGSRMQIEEVKRTLARLKEEGRLKLH